MFPLIILAISVIVIVSDAFLKPSLFKYLIMLFSGLFAVIIAFNYYELLGGFLFEQGMLANHAYGLSFVLITAAAFSVFKVIGTYAIRQEIKFPPMVSKAVSVVCAILFAFLSTGVLLIAVGQLPLSPKYPYARFAEKAVIIDQKHNIMPNKAVMNVDGLVAGFFETVSSGSFSGSNSFGVVRAGFLDSCYLNREKVVDEENQVDAMTGFEAIKISMSDKNAVRKAHTNLRTESGKAVPQIDGKQLYIIKCPFNLRPVESGGVGGRIELLFCQLRIMCNDSYENGFQGKADAVYPYGYLNDDRKLVKAALKEVVTFERQDGMRRDVYIAFYVPEGKVPVALAYKQNFVTELPREPEKTEDTQQQDQ